MNTADIVSNPALRGNAELLTPRTSPRFVRLGTERVRAQRSGGAVTFRSVVLRTEYTGVISKLDGFSSTWYTAQRRWVPVDALIEGQLELTRIA